MMKPIEVANEELAAWATLYTSCRERRTPLPVGPRSIGWGIVGASQVAERFAIPAIRRQPPVEQRAGAWVASIFSHNERRGRQFADANQIPLTSLNFTDLLERHDIQAIYLGNHPRHHYAFGLATLLAGKHLFCEPPLGLSADEAQTLHETAARRGLILAVNFVARANPALRWLRQSIQENDLGDLLAGQVHNLTLLPVAQQSWRLQANGGGVLYDRTQHDLDLLRFLFADEIATVYATSGFRLLGAEERTQVDEAIMGQVQLARSRLTIQLHDALFIGQRPAVVRLDGTQGSLDVEHWSFPGRAARMIRHHREQQTELAVPQYDPFWLAIHQFQTAIRTGGAPLADGEDGWRALLALQAMQRSLRERVLSRVH